MGEQESMQMDEQESKQMDEQESKQMDELMGKLRVGIIGLGEVAQVIHLPIMESLPQLYEVVAGCDISSRLLETVGERFRIKSLYSDAKQLIADENIDCVFILNSNEFHAQHAIAALNHGKHVFVEKPMCLTISDAEAIIEARDRAGKQLIVGYMRRFAPAFLQAKEMVQRLEHINYVTVRDFMGDPAPLIKQTSLVQRFTDDIPAQAMAERKELAAQMVREAIGERGAEGEALSYTYGWLAGLASHDISAMRELLGMPVGVKAATQWNDGRNINVIFEYEDFYVMYEMMFDQQLRHDAHITVHSDKQTIKVQYDTPYIRQLPITLHVSDSTDGTLRETQVLSTYKDPYVWELEHVYRVAKGMEQPKTTAEDSLQDLIIFKMIIDAMSNGL